jgi:hypothetical protein
MLHLVLWLVQHHNTEIWGNKFTEKDLSDVKRQILASDSNDIGL